MDDEVDIVDVESVEKMSGDVEPFLISRNTLVNRKTTTQNLKCQMVVAEGSAGVKVGNAEVEVVVNEEVTVPK